MLGPIAYLIFVATGSVGSVTYVVVRLRRGARGGLVMLHIGLAALLCVIVLGIPAGNFYSHGFDIPWWTFGLFGSVCMLLSAVVALVVTRVVRREKHNKPMQPTCETHAADG